MTQISHGTDIKYKSFRFAHKTITMLHVKSFVFNEFQENTYVVWDQTGQCAIIDPGCMYAHEQMQLSTFIASNGLNPTFLLNTHCHIDHVLGNVYVSEKYGLPLHLHEGELFTYQETKKWTAMFGIPPLTPPAQLQFLAPGDKITLGEYSFEVLFTPGHSIASVSFYFKDAGVVFAGDVLFKGSIGRTDLPGGNMRTLLTSIKEQLMVLPNETKVYSGHMEETTIGHEKTSNPYLIR